MPYAGNRLKKNYQSNIVHFLLGWAGLKDVKPEKKSRTPALVLEQ